MVTWIAGESSMCQSRRIQGSARIWACSTKPDAPGFQECHRVTNTVARSWRKAAGSWSPDVFRELHHVRWLKDRDLRVQTGLLANPTASAAVLCVCVRDAAFWASPITASPRDMVEELTPVTYDGVAEQPLVPNAFSN